MPYHPSVVLRPTLVACVYEGELRLRSLGPTSDSGRGSFEGEFEKDILLILRG